jgi:CheY-like chemotaxis protein
LSPEHRTVLVVDDSADLRAIYSLVLEGLGYDVATAANGRSGLSRVADVRPAAILLDMMMPEMDGLEFLERLPQEIDDPPPVIAMSAFDKFEHDALQRGARVFLHKPIDSQDLAEALDAVLSGAEVAPSLLAQQRHRVAAHRERAAAHREAFLDRVGFGDRALQTALRSTVAWCSAYFGMPAALVDVRRGDTFEVQARAGDPMFEEGQHVDKDRFVCSDVVDAASPMLIGDLAASPVYRRHPTADAGFRFYVGVPLSTRAGVAFGTLCLLDRAPRVLHGNDLSMLEALAAVISEQVASSADGAATSRSAFVAPNVLTRDMFQVLLSTNLQGIAGERGAMEVALVDLGDDREVERISEEIYRAAGRLGLGLAGYRRGVTALVIPADTRSASDDRMRLALAAAQNAAPGLRGIGVVSVETGGTRLAGPHVIEALADEALNTSISDGGIRRVTLHAEQLSDDVLSSRAL